MARDVGQDALTETYCSVQDETTRTGDTLVNIVGYTVWNCQIIIDRGILYANSILNCTWSFTGGTYLRLTNYTLIATRNEARVSLQFTSASDIKIRLIVVSTSGTHSLITGTGITV
jgi:hypothetical protein